MDHIEPRIEGGADDLLNLVTACLDCNLGKGAVRLSDDSAVGLKHDQLAQLEERREQLEMMLEWQRSLADFDGQVVDTLTDRWCELAGWEGVTESGRAKLQKLIKKFGPEEVTAAMHIAIQHYVEYSEEGEVTEESTISAFNKIGGICRSRADDKTKPYLKDLYYIRKIVENRCGYFNKGRATQLLTVAFSWGADPVRLTDMAKATRNWSSWQGGICQYIDEISDGEASDGD